MAKPRKSGQRWTPSDERKLADLAKKGASTERIARELERSKGAVRGKASEEDVTLKPDDRKGKKKN